MNAPPVTPPPRNRLVTLCGILTIGWILWWYTLDGSPGLLIISSLVALFALVAPQRALGSTRSYVWSGLAFLLLALSANIERISPPTSEMIRTPYFFYDRVVTTFWTLALLGLFMRHGRNAATLLMAGSIPMLMLTLGRNGGVTEHPVPVNLVLWISLALYFLISQANSLARPRAADVMPLQRREFLGRLAVPFLSLAIAALLLIPVNAGVRGALAWFDEMNLFGNRHHDQQNSFHLSLSAPPGGFGSRMRPLMSIRSPGPPGYLRQNVYRDFVKRHWAQRPMNSGVALDAVLAPSGQTRYDIPAYGIEDPLETPWRVRVMGSRWRFGLALPTPVSAVVIDENVGITSDQDDMLDWQTPMSPPAFEAVIVQERDQSARELADPVGPAMPMRFPLLMANESGEPLIEPTYLNIPAEWTNDVATWAAQIDGLANAPTPETAMRMVADYFQMNFRYRLEGPVSTKPDPVRAFMREQQGHCTLFATASALILRHTGLPSRMVSGFLATERHPVTGEWIVRERDAHAWVEAWDEQAGGWRRLETTAPGGVPGNFPEPSALRAWLEAARLGWHDFRNWLNTFNPLIWLAEAGATLFVWLEISLQTKTGKFFVGIALALIFGALLWKLRSSSPGEPEERLRHQLEEAATRLAARNIPTRLRRQPGQTWSEWTTSIQQHLPAETIAPLLTLLEDYQSIRYAPRLNPAHAIAWLDAAKMFKPSCTSIKREVRR
ncbi:MAG: transglutaminase-like domain-containing protein [Kiritimatiellia bacterium]